MKIGRNELEKVYSRMDWENMQRMVIASLALVVLFSAIWSSYLIGGTNIPKVLVVLGFVSTILWDCLFVLVGYYWLKMRPDISANRLVMAFWIGTIAQMLCCMALTDSMVVISIYWGILIVMFALVPLTQTRCFLFSEGAQFLALVVLRGQDRIDKEHMLYLMSGLLFCAIISRQSYLEHFRRIEHKCRLSDVRGMAEIDAMTKLLNRRGLNRKIATIWPMCQRQKIKIAVVMFDIDNFKKYNDTFGHLEGDRCISAVAQKLSENTPRRSDFAARVGGEEFIVVLTGISEAEVIKWARRCKNSIESMQIPQAKGNFLSFVSVSMGICQKTLGSTSTFEELSKEADRCLYQSKEHGRASIYINNECVGRTLPQTTGNKVCKERGLRLLG